MPGTRTAVNRMDAHDCPRGTGIPVGVMDNKQDKQMLLEMVLCAQEEMKSKASKEDKTRGTERGRYQEAG